MWELATGKEPWSDKTPMQAGCASCPFASLDCVKTLNCYVIPWWHDGCPDVSVCCDLSVWTRM